MSPIYRNLWSGNLFLKCQDLASHKVVLVDWTHAQIAPLTLDVIHLLFTSAGGSVQEFMTEALNDYYDFLKVLFSLISRKLNNIFNKGILSLPPAG